MEASIWLLISIVLLIKVEGMRSESLSRADQCKAMRRNKVLGRIWMDWQSYYDVAQPCMLVCYVKQIGHYAAYGHVTDGTPCFPGSGDICVSGKCQQRSCDSNENVEDKCRQCGGDNRECQPIRQQFYQPFDSDLYSYHYLTTIPAGATNVNLTESETKNYIALRTNNFERFNQDFKLDPPGLYTMAGCNVSYQRIIGKHNLTESVYILGPTDRPIHIEILHQQPNKGVTVNYWINSTLDPGNLLEANERDGSYSRIVSIYNVRVQPKPEPLEQTERNDTFSRIVSKYLIRVKPRNNNDPGALKEANSKPDTWSRIVQAYRIHVKPRLTVEKLDPLSPTYEGDYYERKKKVDRTRRELMMMSDAAAMPNTILIPTDNNINSTHFIERSEIRDTCGERKVNRYYVAQDLSSKFNTSNVLRPVPKRENCPSCLRAKLNETVYCKSAFVIRITPLSREVEAGEVKYDSKIHFIYRVMPGLELTAREYIYTAAAAQDSQCSCPLLTIDKEYIVMGDYNLHDNIFKLFLHHNSYTQIYKFNQAYQFSLLQNSAQCI